MSFPKDKRRLRFRSKVSKMGDRFYIIIPKAYTDDVKEHKFYSKGIKKNISVEISKLPETEEEID
jgi:hypothetical protein